MKMTAAIFLTLFVLAALPAAAQAKSAGCNTDARVAAFEALLKTKPARAAVEDFIKKNHAYRDKAYTPRKSPSRLVAVISDADCNFLDYQATQHVFYVSFRKGIVTEYTQNLMSGGP